MNPVGTETLDAFENLDLSADTPPEFDRLLSSVRRHLHMYPETGFQEYETSAFLRDLLEAHGLDVRGPVAETGLFVDIKGDMPGPTVAFRADIDALAAVDSKPVRYASRNEGAAHLCGHDAHTSVAVGVALLLHANRHHMPGTARILFQPNEEGVPSGAPEMIKAGALDGVREIFATHVDPTLEVGQFGLIKGPATAAVDRFEITVWGPSSGHSARPHQSIDTIWIATQITQNLYQLVGRVTDSRNSAILTICKFHGGTAFNVIPSEVVFGGTLRCVNPEDRAFLRQRIIDAAQQLGSLHHARIDTNYMDGAPAVINDYELTDTIARTIRDMYGPQAVSHIPAPSMGAEDFAFYLESIPGVLLRVGTHSSRENGHPLHDSHFDIDERSIAPAARLMANVMMTRLNHS